MQLAEHIDGIRIKCDKDLNQLTECKTDVITWSFDIEAEVCNVGVNYVCNRQILSSHVRQSHFVGCWCSHMCIIIPNYRLTHSHYRVRVARD